MAYPFEPYDPSCPIDSVGVTTDTLTDRGGLALFSRYAQGIGILPVLGETFAHLRGNAKGLSVTQLFHQAICFFGNGDHLHMTRFDELKKDPGYAAVLEAKPEELASSHQMKRFFKSIPLNDRLLFRQIFKTIFLWRLQIEKPAIIYLTLDTEVFDNDQAAKREGVSPTYKGVAGFQPLHLIWNGLIIDVMFRGGKKHGNAGKEAQRMVEQAVNFIRREYDPQATIIVRCDAGFFDQANFAAFDRLDVGFIATGKVYPWVKEHVAASSPRFWDCFYKGRTCWHYQELGYRCASWPGNAFYRAFYTTCREDEYRQRLLEFVRPDNVILTNIGVNERALQYCSAEERERLLKPQTIIHAHHLRGADELPHRGLKDFGTEQLPFRRFAHNNAFYYMMVLAFNVFEGFKVDTLKEVITVTGYATTVRRLVFDIAAKIVTSARQTILKVTQAVMDRLQFKTLWQRCLAPTPIRPRRC